MTFPKGARRYKALNSYHFLAGLLELNRQNLKHNFSTGTALLQSGRNSAK